MATGGNLGLVDFVTLASHKFHGPSGVGVVLCRTPRSLLKPLMYGGHQQHGLRPGTEPVGALTALADALEDANHPTRLPDRITKMRQMTDKVWATLIPFITAGLVLPTGSMERTPHLVSFCVHGVHRSELVSRMEKELGILLSSGSACSTDSSLPSHVLDALRVPDVFIHGSVRISLSHLNTMDEMVNRLCPALVTLLKKYVINEKK